MRLCRVRREIEKCAVRIEQEVVLANRRFVAPMRDELPSVGARRRVGPAGGEIYPVEEFAGVWLMFDADGREQRGHEIDDTGEVVDGASCLNAVWPAHSEGRPHAAFVDISFFPFEPVVPPVGVGTVVREVNDNGVLGEFQLIELGEDSSYVGVLIFDHGQRASGFVRQFCFCGSGRLLERAIFPTIPVGSRDAPRRVWGREWNVAQEGRALILLDELERFVCANVDDVAGFAVEHSVEFEFRVEVFAPVSCGVTEEGIETARIRMKWPLASVVPLAESARFVAGILQMIGQRGLIEIQTFLAERDSLYAASGVVAAGEEFGTRGRAYGAHVEAIHAKALRRDSVDVRGLNRLVPCEAEVAKSGVVREKDDDVWGCCEWVGER